VTNVTKLTITLGAVLVVLGLGAYVLSGAASITAAIPAFLGLPILIAGVVANAKPDIHRHAIHVALVIAVLGALGSLGGVFPLDDLGTAAVVSLITIVLCVAYIVVGVRSFIAARRSEG